MPPRASRPLGVALVDKPAGPSSFALVADLRRRTRARTGHTGTLDPFATGLLVLLSGLATKLAPCFVGLDKRYVTEVDLTATTSTGDPEGEILERHDAPSRHELDARLALLRGEVELPIPAASAVKIGGERAYRLARQAIEVAMPLRRSQVYALDVIAYRGDAHEVETRDVDGQQVDRDRVGTSAVSGISPVNGTSPVSGASPVNGASLVSTVQLELHVSSGTYVRSLASALGGHCTALRRMAVGPFRVEEADAGGLLPVSSVLARLPEDALARVPERVRAQVLAFEAETPPGAIPATGTAEAGERRT